ncbi:MAG: HNH endonuclease [Dehalococcoidia bacterium]|jgi:5-methylcytosine-specific restriction endonuclease McrA
MLERLCRDCFQYFLRRNRERPTWEAHHKVAVAEGGGECGLDGYETLCRDCHKAETSALRKRLSRQNKNTSDQMRLI